MRLGALLILCITLPGAAFAQSNRSRVITVVTPFAAVNGTDVTTRIGFDAFSTSPQELEAFVKSEIQNWQGMTKSAEIEPQRPERGYSYDNL